MAHDFKAFPELTNGQMAIYYFMSPHKQIFSDFTATCVKVHDGDTITLRWTQRDFDFPVRFSNIAAPELKDAGGKESKEWLESKVLNREVDIIINPSARVEKWGRLLGNIVLGGMDLGEESIIAGKSVAWKNRNDGVIANFGKELNKIWA